MGSVGDIELDSVLFYVFFHCGGGGCSGGCSECYDFMKKCYSGRV